ncbi:MAG: DNA primase [Desulfuromonadaceae bacterium]|nr:DNA primase [Desulfuromonadaceae bacterium]MDD2855809.1 DNA primase [Desulfuromonadaceae bacterium]
MIPDEKVREVADRTSIVEVVSDYLPLRRAGSNYLGLCPFHSEKTPSFTVNPAKEIFHCFGCGVGGNAFSFVMRIEGLSFPESVKLLARKTGVEIEERQLTPAERKSQDEYARLLRINELAASYYRSVLLNSTEGEAAREYLVARSVGDDVSEAYGLGFAPDRWDGLAKHLKNNSVEIDDALKLGILRKSENGLRDLFRNRLIFPIKDTRGQVIAFAGRVLDAALPKYINSPESPLYHKSSVLFGLEMALQSIRTSNSAIIVEGYFDHLALYRAGVHNVVATCGTALTSTHSSLLKRHAEKVYTLFDSDSAGKKATIRSMELFLEQRLPVYVISLPAKDDPDSFLATHSRDEFIGLLDKSRPAFEYFVRSVLAETTPDSVDSKVRIIDEIVPRFRKISDSIERDLYEKEICRLLGITVHAFRKRMSGGKIVPRDIQNFNNHAPTDSIQDTLLALLLNYHEARAEIMRSSLETLFNDDYLELANFLVANLSDSDSSGNLSHLTEQITKPELKALFSRIMVSDAYLADIDWRSVLSECTKSHEKKALASIKEIAGRLAVLEPDSIEYKQLLEQADALRTRKSKL